MTFRQNKIKSKKYRKIARKEKNKEKLAELERLAEIDPQAAAEELERIDRYARGSARVYPGKGRG